MPNFSALNNTGRPWWLVALWIVATLTLAWSAGVNALVNIARESNPSLALRFGGGDATALAVRADELLATSATKGVVDPRIEPMVQASLRAQALNPRALRVAAFLAEAKPPAEQAGKLFHLANSMSRRELGVQLWLIQDGVARNDIPAILRSYDVALRSNDGSQNLLFPVLTKALEDREIRVAFARYVRERPLWLYPFVNYAIANSEKPDLIAAALARGGGLPAQPQFFRDLESALIGQMLAKSDPMQIRNYFMTLNGADARSLTSSSFASFNVDAQRAPVTWGPIKAAAVEGGFTTTADRSAPVLHGYAAAGERGLIARKLLFLPTGRYAVLAQRTMAGVTGETHASLVVSCLIAGTPRPFWVGNLAKQGSFDPVTISAGCPAQYLDVVLDNSKGQAVAEITIDAVEIEPDKK